MRPRSPEQAAYRKAMESYDVVFALGPAGTGKTALATSFGVELVASGVREKLILCRPAVEAGERLGFLPGDMQDKITPYARPFYDVLHQCMTPPEVARALARGTIEIAPLAFMRGRTLSGAFVILDEAQNCTPLQIRMLLTRLGDHAQVVVAGDPTQVDLPGGSGGGESGLRDAVGRLRSLPGVAVVTFSSRHVFRHPLVKQVIAAYESS